MTSADRLLDNHVVISEHRKSCYRKTSAQSNQIRGSARTLFVYLVHSQLDYFVLALESRTVWCRDKSENMSAQPDQKIRLRTTVFWLPYNSSVQQYFARMASWERHSLSRAYNKYQNQTAQLYNWELYFNLFAHMCVCVPYQTLQTCRLSGVFLADRKV